MAELELVLTDYETLRTQEALQTVFATYQHHGMSRELQDLNAAVYSFLDQMMRYEESRKGVANDKRDDMRFRLALPALEALGRTMELVLPHEQQKTHLRPDQHARRVSALCSVADKLAKATAALRQLERGLADGSLRIQAQDGTWM